jgi:Amt family ammonium transporter
MNNIPINGCFALAPSIPTSVWFAFQMMFALMVPILVTGAWAEKMTFSAFLIFMVLWPIVVYYPLAHAVWGGGWLSWIYDSTRLLGVRDFAGGIVIHATAGAAGFVVSLMLTRRKPNAHLGHHNLPLTILGGSLIWGGWYSFNGGSAVAAKAQTGTALMNTHISACFSAAVWTLVMFTTSKPHRWHLTEIINGALAGLAGITAGSGFVEPWAAAVIGTVVGFASCLSVRLLKGEFRLDDVLDVTSLQGVPGILGTILVGLFASPRVSSGPGPNSVDGFVRWPLGVLMASGGDETSAAWAFLGVQVLGVVVGVAWSAVCTFFIMVIIKQTVGADVDNRVEEIGLDLQQIGEQAYDDTLDVVLDLGAESATTLLCEAASAGNLQEVARIIRCGAAPDSADYDGRRPLHVAAAEGRLAVCKFLLDVHKVDANVVDNFGNVPLLDAVNGSHVRVVKLLRSHGATADATVLGDALCEAAASGSLARVECLIAGGANVDAGDYDQRSALMIAASEGHAEVVGALLKAGANANQRDRWGGTAMQDAERSGQSACIDLLQRHAKSGPIAADVVGAKATGAAAAAAEETQSLAGGSVRELCAAAQDNNVDEMRRLVKRGASIHATDYDGRSPLHLAASNGHVEAIEFILSFPGVNVNALDRWRNTPLNEALKANRAAAAALLRKHHGVVMNQVLGSRLCRAAASNDRKALEELAATGVNLNAPDYDGRTALHLAASEGHQELVEWLVSARVHLTPTDHFGFKPLDDAQRGGHKQVVRVLTRAIAGVALHDDDDDDDDKDDDDKDNLRTIDGLRSAVTQQAQAQIQIGANDREDQEQSGSVPLLSMGERLKQL